MFKKSIFVTVKKPFWPHNEGLREIWNLPHKEKDEDIKSPSELRCRTGFDLKV